MAREKSEASMKLDYIEKTVYLQMKPLGFRKHGRLLHRFVSGDISQAIQFFTGQAYLDAQHWMWVRVGIRVPECALSSFEAEAEPKKYYPEPACNIRFQLNVGNGKKALGYDLRKDPEPIIEDILGRLERTVIPAFDALSSREAILERRREFPWMDEFRHLILLDEAMIYGRRGERERAEEIFNEYYRQVISGEMGQKDPGAIRSHLLYLNDLAKRLGIEIRREIFYNE